MDFMSSRHTNQNSTYQVEETKYKQVSTML